MAKNKKINRRHSCPGQLPKHFGSWLCLSNVQVALQTKAVHRVLECALFHA